MRNARLQAKVKEVKEAASIKTPPSRAVQVLCASRLVTLISAARQSAQRPKAGPQKKGEGPANEELHPATGTP